MLLIKESAFGDTRSDFKYCITYCLVEAKTQPGIDASVCKTYIFIIKHALINEIIAPLVPVVCYNYFSLPVV
jgi:hypothetical protein